MNPRRRIVWRIAGVVLVAFGFFVAAAWFLWLVPMFSRFDPRWELQFTNRGYWDEVQRHIRRYGWTHDDSEVVGTLGDKAWAEWIMRRAGRGEMISNCGNIGHKDAALEYITCQSPTPRTNGFPEPWATEKAWLAWWKENNAKSQKEWIQDGLAQHGVTVDAPASPQNFEPLLSLLGNTNTNRLDVSYVPRYVKYNAFRWLRDSGFDPVAFAVSNITPQSAETVKQGLFAYSKRLKLYPDLEGAGILSFGKQPVNPDDTWKPHFFSTPVQATAYALMLVPLALGVLLLLFSYRQMGRTTNPTPKENSQTPWP